MFLNVPKKPSRKKNIFYLTLFVAQQPFSLLLHDMMKSHTYNQNQHRK